MAAPYLAELPHDTLIVHLVRNPLRAINSMISTGHFGTQNVYAEFLAKQFEPVFTQKDILNIDNYNAYVKLLAKGVPVKPFNIAVPNIPKGDTNVAGKLKELSYLTYGKDRAEIEAQINEKYKK